MERRRCAGIVAASRPQFAPSIKFTSPALMALFRCLRSSLALLPALLVLGPAQAVTVPDLYETAQPVDGSRDAAFTEALKTVLVRVSGQRDAAARVGEVSDPRKYVQRFGFTA